MIKKWLLTVCVLFLFYSNGFSATCTKYVSNSGSGTTCSEASPCALTRVFSNAVADDVWCARAGTYTITGHLTTTNAGSAGHPITLQNYPGESPAITNSSGYEIFVEDPYWIFDGLSITVANLADHDHAVINIGHNNDANHTTIQNCTLTLSSAAGHDNVGVIRLQADRSNYAYIYNNVLVGTQPTTYCSDVIQFLGGHNVGTKILFNDISGGYAGVYYKHRNSDTASTGAEVAYNYIHDVAYGLYGNPLYVNFHDNITEGALFGDNGGGDGQGQYCTFNHNTVYEVFELWNPGEGPIANFTITNNIMASKTTYGTTEASNTWDYNMYGDDAAIGAHDQGTTSATYTGGATYPDYYVLTGASAGKGDGSDSKDLGADVTLVRGYSAASSSGTFSGGSCAGCTFYR